MRAYSIDFAEDAVADIECFRKAERRLILDEIDRQLTREPAVVTTNRKQLRPNRLAEWELRTGPYRVFYDVTEPGSPGTVGKVKIVAVGRKEHNRLYIGAEEFRL